MLRFLRDAALVAGGVCGVVFGLLLPDLFYAIPWPVRKAFGWMACAAFAAVCTSRLLAIRPGDQLEMPDEPRQWRHAWIAWALAGTCAVLAIPMLRQPGNLGFGDWDLFLGKYEAARRTIVLFGQFPWWDPWTRGGFPLAANPQCGVIGVAMPLVLAFGTSVGMRIATIVCFVLAAQGARRLARLWLGDPYAAAAAGLIYALNGCVMVAAVAAYHVSMCYPALPWMLYHVFRLERRPRDGMWLGFWAAFNLLNGIQYFTVYIVLIAGVAWVRQARVNQGVARLRLLEHTVLALGTFLALAGWRIGTTGLVYRDFPRNYQSLFAETPLSLLRYCLHRPVPATLTSMSNPYFWETIWYVGPVVIVLAALSLAWGWRWWHTLSLACAWLGSGSITWYYPSYWLAHFPAFSTMHVVTRWRFMAMLGVALAAASVLAAWRRSQRRELRWLATLAIGAIAVDYLAYGFLVLPVAFSVAPDEALFPGRPLPRGAVVQVEDALGFPAIARGYGVIFGFEPLMGYDRRAATARFWRGHPAYVGEHWTSDGPVQPVSWSPNRIELAVAPNQLVSINQNPGSYWLVNGRPKFAGARCAEKEQPFEARADERGRLVLQVQPRGLKLGLALHGAGLALVAATWTAIRLRRGTGPDGDGPPLP